METIGSYNKPGSQTVHRALVMLDAFTPERGEIGLSELAREFNVDKATTHRLARTLVQAGLLEQDPQTRRYRLGLRLLSLAAVVQANLDVRSRAQSTLHELCEALGETVYLLVLRDHRSVCVERIEGIHLLRDLSTQVGTSLPLHIGAGPKAILAFLSEDEQRAVLSGELERRTPQTDVDPLHIRERLELIREQGWAMSAEDVAAGAGGIAAPIFDRTGAVVAAVSVGGLVQRLLSRRDEMAAVVVAAGREISGRLGHGASNFSEASTTATAGEVA